MKQKYLLSGSSLVEVLSGISILSLVLGMGLMLFQQLNGPYAAAQLHHAQSLCRNALYDNSRTELANEDSRHEIGPYQIERRVIALKPGLWQIEVKCYQQERLLDQRVRRSRKP
ncbi:MAG: hypothetical protein AAFP02_03520 [Bacteroidota bacterium]